MMDSFDLVSSLQALPEIGHIEIGGIQFGGITCGGSVCNVLTINVNQTACSIMATCM